MLGRDAARGLVLSGLLGVAACGGDDGRADGDPTVGGTVSPTDGGGATEGEATDAGTLDGDSGELPPPECVAGEVACGSVCADLDSDPSNCGQCGRSCVIPQAIAACEAGECAMAGCDPGYSDCDGELVSGCEVAVDCQEGASCATACGSQGTVDCTDVCAGGGGPACLAPAEVCNVGDDDCDGACDHSSEAGPLPGCRVGVHRSNSPTLGHYYTTDLAEAQSGDLNLESQDYFFLYAPGVEGLQPLFRCIKPNGKRWLTTSTDCEGTAAPELTVGFISPDDRCNATPLYRLLNAGPDAHFYTVSAPERDNAVNNLGFQDQGIAGYVWSEP